MCVSQSSHSKGLPVASLSFTEKAECGGGGGLGYNYFLNRAGSGISEQGGIVEHTFIKQTFLFTKEKLTIYRRATW